MERGNLNLRDGCVSYHVHNAANCSCPSKLILFSSFGRLSVTRSILGYGNVMRESWTGGGGVVK